MIADSEYIIKLEKNNERLTNRLKSLEKIVASFKKDNPEPVFTNLLTKEYFSQEGRDHMYRMLVENMSEGAVVVNSHFTIVYSNKLFAEITGNPLQKVIGADLCQFLNNDDARKIVTCLDESKVQQSFCQVALKRKESESGTFLLSVTSFLMENEYYYIIIPTDINFHTKMKEGYEYKLGEYTAKLATANKHLSEKNRKLNEINRYLDNFVHSIAHDLRAPVSNIKMIEELFSLAPESDKSQLLNSLFGNIKRLDDTLIGLVEIIEARGSMENKAEIINIHQIIEEILKEKEKVIKAQEAKIVIKRKTTCNIHYIRENIYCILRNMVSNALKYSSTERPLQLTIAIEKNNGYFNLIFRDNGIGIDLKKHCKHLFTPFSRFSSQAEGLGVGLHIVNTLVQKNGGYIDVQSKPEKGTTFSIHLREIFHTN